MSRKAVSDDTLVSAAHLALVNFRLPFQPVDDLALPVIEWLTIDRFPEPAPAHDIAKNSLGAIKRTIETGNEPQQPSGNVEILLLRRFEDVLIGSAISSDLRRHAVESLCGFFCARQIRDGACHAPVTVIKRVDRDKPEMGNTGLQDGINGSGLEPIEEARHFLVQPLCGGRFIMDMLPADWP